MLAEHWSAARALAAAFLGGPWELESLIERTGKRGRWARSMARRILAAFPQPWRPSIGTLAQFIAADPGLTRYARIRAHKMHAAPAELQPVAGNPATWMLPQLTTPDALAKWLGISRGELDWFAGRYERSCRQSRGPLSHYRYHWLPKRSGGFRLLEIPKARLKGFQAELLHGLLDRIPPHDSAHGFRSGRSIVTFASPHAGQQIVLRIDLKNFFSSIAAARVRGLFMTSGYPEAVARLLTGLCTNSVPESVWQDEELLATALPPSIADTASRLLRRPHLPQGAPTSPALANLCAYRLDCRLQGLARSADATYTRYADDLVFSGGAQLARSAKRFHVAVCSIALDEGFEVHTRKTRIMRRAARQHAVGLVLNEKPNIRRADFDRLKATLYNCRQHGPASQNLAGHTHFKAHLCGMVAHIERINPGRGDRLRAILDKIVW